MKQIPETRQDVKKILREQLAMLAEASHVCNPQQLCTVSLAMVEISKTLPQL